MTDKNDYRLIKTGNNLRREYFYLNRSPFFSSLPEVDTAQEQKKSYQDFLNKKLKNLLNFYFPVEFKDHNNNIKLEVTNFRIQEPEINSKEACIRFLTWAYKLYLNWNSDWFCKGINIVIDETISEEENIFKWLEKSFKFDAFSLKKEKKEDKYFWISIDKKENIKITIEILEKKEDSFFVSFRHQQEKEILLCYLPKMNEQGSFIINGHYKIAVCQSVRASNVYCFYSKEKDKFYSEIIPVKGSWINISTNPLTQKIELKFLNSKKVITLQEIFDYFEVPKNSINILLNETQETDEKIKTQEEINEKKNKPENYNGPKFIFTSKNSYFEFGKLGRKKLNKRSLIRSRVLNQTLFEDIKNEKGEVVFKKDSFINEKNIEELENVLLKGTNSLILPNSINSINWIKIKHPTKKENSVTIVGIVKYLPEEKTFFDLSDLFCAISLFINVQEGATFYDSEEEKDKLNNQIIRRIGDLLHLMFDSKLGGFLYQDMSQKYLANISQLKKTDLSKMPNLKDFDNLLKKFFNTSELVQLQNQNNPLSEIAYTRKVSVLGLGGFSVNNITLSARNVDESHYGRYGLMSTQEGKNFGLTHNLTLNATIDEDGQVLASYRIVKKGIIENEIIYLTSDEEHEYYITHCNIEIDEKNHILNEKILVRHKGKIIWVEKEKVNLIDSSFFHLSSVEESVGPFTPYNDATRTLMTSNMQRGSIPPLKSEEPLISTGAEVTLRNNSFLTVKAEEDGIVEYADNQKIIINSSKKKKTYELFQNLISNKDILNFSKILVKKGDKIKKGEFIADGHYINNGELSLGHNLRVAYMSFHCNFEDSIIFSDRLIKNDFFTYVVAKEYLITRYNTDHGPEVFSGTDIFSSRKNYPNLDQDGIIKVGSVISENELLVRKLTPQVKIQESEEEQLLFKILGDKGQRYTNSSFYLPKSENNRGVVYKVERQILENKNELETVKICVAYERKIEDGDKVTARYGNKGIIKIIPESDMPYTEEGSFDIILNPLGVPSRMNMGQLLETVLAEASFRLKIKLLVRPFNKFSLEDVKKIASEAKISDLGNRIVWDGRTGQVFDKKIFTGRIYTMLLNHKSTDKIHSRATGPYSLIFQQPLKGRKREGGQRVGEMEGWCLEAHGAAKTLLRLHSSDDIRKRRELQNYLLFDKQHINLLYNRSESFNLVVQYLRGIGFNLEAKDFQNKNVDFFKYFYSTKK